MLFQQRPTVLLLAFSQIITTVVPSPVYLQPLADDVEGSLLKPPGEPIPYLEGYRLDVIYDKPTVLLTGGILGFVNGISRDLDRRSGDIEGRFDAFCDYGAFWIESVDPARLSFHNASLAIDALYDEIVATLPAKALTFHVLNVTGIVAQGRLEPQIANEVEGPNNVRIMPR